MGMTDDGARAAALDDALRAEIQRLRCEKHAAERVAEYCEWQLAELYRMYPFRDRVGDRLRRARERSGLSRAMLARVAGLHPSTVARAETTGRTSYGSLVAVCDVLGITPDWTVGEDPRAD